MSIVSIYVDGVRRVVESPDPILSRANVALSTLERYMSRLDEDLGALARRDRGPRAAGDAMSTAQRMEMVRRVSVEIEEYVLELGVNGRQVSLQPEELIHDNDTMRELLVRDYYASPEPATTEGCGRHRNYRESVRRRSARSDVAGRRVRLSHHHRRPGDTWMRPRGYRLLARISRLQFAHVDRLCAVSVHCRPCQLSSADLQAVEGIGGIWPATSARARACPAWLNPASNATSSPSVTGGFTMLKVIGDFFRSCRWPDTGPRAPGRGLAAARLLVVPTR